MTNQTFKNEAEFLKMVRECGAAAGTAPIKEVDFLVNSAIYASQSGADTSGGDKDDASRWLKEYVKSHDTKGGKENAYNQNTLNARTSELRTLLKAARLRNADFADMLVELRQALVDAKNNGAKIRMRQAVVDISKFQHKQGDRRLTLDEALAHVLPSTGAAEGRTKEKDEGERLSAQLKALEAIYNGTKATNSTPARDPMPSPELQAAIELLKRRIAVLTFTAQKEAYESTMRANAASAAA